MNNMKDKTEFKPQVYYDGLCMVCSREIDHYKRSRGAEGLDFVDITSPSFSPEREGLNGKAVHKHMHVRRADGTIVTGVEAFREIWSNLPGFKFLVGPSRLPLVRELLDFGYAAFAQIRPWLPRRKDDCLNSPYCEIHPTKGNNQ